MRTVRGVGDASKALLRVDVFFAGYGGCDGRIAALKQQAVCLARAAGRRRIGGRWGSHAGSVSALACACVPPPQNGAGLTSGRIKVSVVRNILNW